MLYLSLQPRPFLQSINTCIIYAILVEILQKINDKKYRYNSSVDLAEDPLCFRRVELFTSLLLIESVVVV